MKAAHVAIETMKGHLDAVYDVTVAYEGLLGASGPRRPAPSMPGKQASEVSLYRKVRWLLKIEFSKEYVLHTLTKNFTD